MLYKIADVVFDIKPIYDYSKKLMKEYEVNGDCVVDCVVEYSFCDIQTVKAHFNLESDDFAENILIFKRVSEFITEFKDGLLYHSSSFSYKGQGVLIVADSGTGKSTHSSFWRQLYGDDVAMINDDKPFLRRIDGRFYIYGSPWQGKHNLGANTRCLLKAVCLLRRSDENSLEKLEKGEFVGEFLNHALRISTPKAATQILDFCQGITENCDFYILNAKYDVSAAKVCHDTLFGDL